MKRISMLLAAMLLLIGGCSEADIRPETTSPPAASTTAAAVATTATPTTVADEPVETPTEPRPIVVEMDRDIAYGPDADQVLDVLYQEGFEDAPTIVLAHGGGFVDGNKSSERPLAEFLVNRGFVAVIANYRLTHHDGRNAFPTPVNDVACAAAWLSNHATEYGGDPSTMLITGYSAGAQLAGMLATNTERDWLEDCSADAQLDFDAFIGLAGPYDFATAAPTDTNICAYLFGLAGEECTDADRALWAEANVVDQVTADDPPTLLLGGDRDCRVSAADPDTGLCTSSIDRMSEALTEAGVDFDAVILPGANHGEVGIGVTPFPSVITDFIQRHGIPITPPDQPIVTLPDAAAVPPEQALPGVWNTSSGHPFALQSDGSWTLFGGVVKLPWTWGSYSLDGDVLTLTTADDALLLCHGTTASYRVGFFGADHQIYMTAIDDPCAARADELIGGPYDRVPDSLVPGYLK